MKIETLLLFYSDEEVNKCLQNGNKGIPLRAHITYNMNRWIMGWSVSNTTSDSRNYKRKSYIKIRYWGATGCRQPVLEQSYPCCMFLSTFHRSADETQNKRSRSGCPVVCVYVYVCGCLCLRVCRKRETNLIFFLYRYFAQSVNAQAAAQSVVVSKQVCKRTHVFRIGSGGRRLVLGSTPIKTQFNKQK